MKINKHSFPIASGLFALGLLAGCESPSNSSVYLDDRTTPYGMDGYVSVGVGSGAVGVGVGYYDPWYYGGPGYPPAAVVGPPVGMVGVGMGPRPMH